MNQQNFICPQCNSKGRSVASIAADETTVTNTTKKTIGIVPGVGISSDGNVLSGAGVLFGTTKKSSISYSILAKLFMKPDKPVLETPSSHTFRFLIPCLMVLPFFLEIKLFGAEAYYDLPILGHVMDFFSTLDFSMTLAVLLFFALAGSIIYTNSKGYKAKEKHLEKRYHKELEQFAKQEKKHSTLGYCYQCHCIFDQDGCSDVADRKNLMKFLNT